MTESEAVRAIRKEHSLAMAEVAAESKEVLERVSVIIERMKALMKKAEKYPYRDITTREREYYRSVISDSIRAELLWIDEYLIRKIDQELLILRDFGLKISDYRTRESFVDFIQRCEKIKEKIMKSAKHMVEWVDTEIKTIDKEVGRGSACKKHLEYNVNSLYNIILTARNIFKKYLGLLNHIRKNGNKLMASTPDYYVISS